MDVAVFLDALCWGNQLAIVYPTVRHTRTGLMRSNRLATVVSRWLALPRASPGGPRVEGKKRILVQLVIDRVKGIINDEMEAVWKSRRGVGRCY